MPAWDKVKNEHNEIKYEKRTQGITSRNDDTYNWHCINPTDSTWNNIQHFSSQRYQCVVDKTLEKNNFV